MIYPTLGRTGLKVSLVSYGSGGPSKLGQNTGISSNDQDLLIHKCIDSGVNLFDTSEAYGDSESILARGLKGVPRESYVLATKCRYLDRGGVMRTPKISPDPLKTASYVCRLTALTSYSFMSSIRNITSMWWNSITRC